MRRPSRTLIAIAILIGLSVVGPQAQKATLAPDPYLTILNNSGLIVSGACIWTYLAGTTTPTTTWSDVNQLSPNPNPVIADSSGRATIFLQPTIAYKFTIEQACTPPAHGAVIRTQDNIYGVAITNTTTDVPALAGETITAGQFGYLSDGSGGKTAGQWYKADSTNSYSSIYPEIGLALATITVGTTGTVRVAGQVTGLNSLVTGSRYYVGLGGNVTTIPQNATRFLGMADSATSFIVSANPPIPTAYPCPYVISSVTGQQNNFNPGIAGPCTIIRMTNASLTSITGFIPGFDGQIVRVVATGAQIDFTNNDSNSLAGQRLNLFATTGKTSLLPGVSSVAAAEYIYESLNATWRLVSHEQGAWITPTFSAANYTGNSSMTWTVAGGGVTTQAYYLKGTTLSVAFVVTGAVGGTLSTFLQIGNGAWGGFTSAGQMYGRVAVQDNATSGDGFGLVQANGTLIQFSKGTGPAATNWSASASFSGPYGVMSFQVQD